MTPDEQTTNHEEALELAALKAHDSNLARCYLDAVSEITRLRTALAASEAKLEKARELRHIVPYLDWTIGPESPGYHPTMPSAVGAFKETLKDIT